MACTPEVGRPWKRLKERGGRKRFLSRTEKDPSWRQRVYSWDQVERQADVGGADVVGADEGEGTLVTDAAETVDRRRMLVYTMWSEKQVNSGISRVILIPG